LVLSAQSYSILLLAAIGIGLTTGGAFPPFSALIAKIYGRGFFGTAMGLTTFLMLPLIFFAAPLSGFLYDTYGNYTLAFQLHIGFSNASGL
jgi:MFS family permease